MAESSRDMTQLIRLVYASMCEGRGGGEARPGEQQCKNKGEEKKRLFSPFESFY